MDMIREMAIDLQTYQSTQEPQPIVTDTKVLENVNIDEIMDSGSVCEEILCSEEVLDINLEDDDQISLGCNEHPQLEQDSEDVSSQ